VAIFVGRTMRFFREQTQLESAFNQTFVEGPKGRPHFIFHKLHITFYAEKESFNHQ